MKLIKIKYGRNTGYGRGLKVYPQEYLVKILKKLAVQWDENRGRYLFPRSLNRRAATQLQARLLFEKFFSKDFLNGEPMLLNDNEIPIHYIENAITFILMEYKDRIKAENIELKIKTKRKFKKPKKKEVF